MAWEGIRVYTECPFKKDVDTILVDVTVLRACNILNDMFRSTEWLLYCELDELEGYPYVHSPVIPRQEVTSSSVEVTEPMNKPVVIHSHHSMQASFSNTDDEYINSNHTLSLLYTSTKKLCEGKMRVRMPCGEYLLVDVKNILYVSTGKTLDVEEFKREAEKKIQRVIITYPYTVARGEVDDEVLEENAWVRRGVMSYYDDDDLDYWRWLERESHHTCGG